MTVTTPRHLYIGLLRPMGRTDSGIATVCGELPEYDSKAHGFRDTLYITRTTCIPCLLKIHSTVDQLLVSLGYNEFGEKVDTLAKESNGYR